MTQLITVKLGTGIKDRNGFYEAFISAGMKMGSWSSDIMLKPAFSISNSFLEATLSIKTIFELGLEEGARRDEIFQAVRRLGFLKCPPEVGPQLRLQYHDQPEDEWLVICMDPIFDSNGDPRMFQVGRNNRGLWLVADLGDPFHIWKPHKKFVLLQPQVT